MLDVAGLRLEPEDNELLSHPLVGGLILFSRNYQSPAQLTALVADIRSIRPEIIIAVDQEGGRVQRFREGFTRLPAMDELGRLYQSDPQSALVLAEDIGWLMAQELIQFDIDISFAPVLDLNRGVSRVIGDRAFSVDIPVLIALATAFIAGMNQAGMVATGKHFPGHGGVAADSHVAIPVDDRSLQSLRSEDMQPFVELSRQLAAVMPAHVIYSAVDESPAGFSAFWLQQVLRSQLGFEGVIFSDDLSMEGASVAGGYAGRAQAALAAGCDMVLVCNNRPAALEVLDFLEKTEPAVSPRLKTMRHCGQVMPDLLSDSRWQSTKQRINQLTSR